MIKKNTEGGGPMGRGKIRSETLRRLLSLLTAAAALFASAGAAPSPSPSPEPPAPTEGVDDLPLWLAEETAEPGTVEYIAYESRAKGGTPARAGVYLPHGYDPEELYDVLILWPGTGGEPRTSLTREMDCRMENGEICRLSVSHVLDRLIETGRVRPLLVVCPSEFSGGIQRVARQDYRTVWRLVTEEYSTYDRDDSLSPKERREHFAFLGFSQGAIYAQSLAMGEMYANFAYYACVCFGSRSPAGAEAIRESGYPVEYMLYLMGNSSDHGGQAGESAFRSIVETCPGQVREGDNAVFLRSACYGHDYVLTLSAIMNMLPRIWPGEGT